MQRLSHFKCVHLNCLCAVLAGSVRPRHNPAAAWLQEPSWQQLLHLAALPALAGITDAIAADPAAWQAVYNAPEPHKAALPGLYSRLPEFRKLLVLRCVRCLFAVMTPD